MQTASKIIPGIYGKYSAWRDKTPDELLAKYHAEGNHFPVLRLRSHGDTTQKIVFSDLLRGQISMIDNYNDIVLIKGDGLPTYHLAHIVDDSLMRVSLVTRGDEWLTSVPLHLQLFKAFDLPAPQYAHLAPINKMEEGKKRKLSKRKDPEANVGYFFEAGYPAQSLLEYIMTLADSAYEDWQRAHEDQHFLDFHFSLEKMNLSGPLFDFTKLQSIANNYLSKISTPQLYQESLEWAQKHGPELAQLMQKYPALTQSALDIERHTEKDPKRFTLYGDIEKGLLFFYPEQWEILKSAKPALPEHIPLETRKAFVAEYQNVFDLEMDTMERFVQLKEI